MWDGLASWASYSNLQQQGPAMTVQHCKGTATGSSRSRDCHECLVKKPTLYDDLQPTVQLAGQSALNPTSQQLKRLC
jgi:hypothetical protein